MTPRGNSLKIGLAALAVIAVVTAVSTISYRHLHHSPSASQLVVLPAVASGWQRYPTGAALATAYLRHLASLPPEVALAMPYATRVNMIGCYQRLTVNAKAKTGILLFNSGRVPMSLSSTSSAPLMLAPLAHNWWVKTTITAPGTYVIRAKRSTCPSTTTWANIITLKLT